MRKKLVVFSILILFLLVIVLYNNWIIVPVKSSAYTLTLVKYAYSEIHKITLSHYVNDVLINDYELKLDVALSLQKPQSYNLPDLTDGKIIVSVELEDGATSSGNRTITAEYDNANDFYKNGLLIYLSQGKSYMTINRFVYPEQYVYFISGKNRKYFHEKAGTTEWVSESEAPKPKMFTRKDPMMIYSDYDYNWKENKWSVIEIK